MAKCLNIAGNKFQIDNAGNVLFDANHDPIPCDYVDVDTQQITTAAKYGYINIGGTRYASDPQGNILYDGNGNPIMYGQPVPTGAKTQGNVTPVIPTAKSDSFADFFKKNQQIILLGAGALLLISLLGASGGRRR
jgi:hypothetical protein